MTNQSFQQKLQNFFESNTLSNTIYQIFINGLILVSLLFLLAEHGITNLKFTHQQIIISDIVIASIFAVDYSIRFYAAQKKFRFFIDKFNIIDLIAIVPSYFILFFGGEASTAPLRALRLLRYLRFLRVSRFFRTISVINALEKKYREDYKRDSEAYKEVEFYHNLLNLYNNLKISTSSEFDSKKINSIMSQISNFIKNLDKRIEQKSEIAVIEEKQNFLIAFYELLKQIEILLKRFGKKRTEWSMMKFEYIIKELGLLLQAEHTKGNVEQLEDIKLTRGMHFLRLLMISMRDILIIFTVGVALNLVIKLTPLHDVLKPHLDQQLPVIEAGMAALIVFITSFNLSYTNSKRANTDIAIIDFTNMLMVYAESVKSLISSHEKNTLKRRMLYERLDHYFEGIGFDILNGVKEGNKYHLRFDTVTTQCLDRVNSMIDPYLAKVDDTTRNTIVMTHGQLLGALNKFQSIANIRSAVIFNALNHWIIQITYFILAVLSPYSVLPRLFIVYLMQRAFFNTAHETDIAIFNVSLSKLPIEDRVLRRICRISAVLSE